MGWCLQFPPDSVGHLNEGNHLNATVVKSVAIDKVYMWALNGNGKVPSPGRERKQTVPLSCLTHIQFRSEITLHGGNVVPYVYLTTASIMQTDV